MRGWPRGAAATLAAIWIALHAAVPLQSERRPGDAWDEGLAGLTLALRQLGTVGVFMHTTAHPDDENNALLAMLSLGQGIRSALVTATRGDGGQNEIGPELFDALAVLRTEELIAAHRLDGAEQYFCRAVDFGYSFSNEETFEKWGRRAILADFVRHIRTIRPDVIVTLPTQGGGGGQHHQASAILTQEAFHAAGDAAQFPEQIRDGLRPWRAKKLYQLGGFPFRGAPQSKDERLVTVDGSVYDPVLGRTYSEIGSEARSMHKCQGMSQLRALPAPLPWDRGFNFGAGNFRYRLAETTIPGQTEKEETTLFDGVDTTLEGLAHYAGDRPPEALPRALAAIAAHVREARRAVEGGGAAAAARPLAAGLSAVRALRGGLSAMGLEDPAVYEIDVRLKLKEQQFARALQLAHAVRVDALAEDGLVVAGQSVSVALILANHGSAGVIVKDVRVAGLQGDLGDCASLRGRALDRGAAVTCSATLTVPPSAPPTEPVYFERLSDAARYRFDDDVPFGLPFRPSAYRASVTLVLSGVDVGVELPIEHRYGPLFSGEKRMDLTVVPAFSARVSPEVAIVPLAAAPTSARTRDVPAANGETAGVRPARLDSTSQSATANRRAREIRVTVTHGVRGPGEGVVTLELPSGWRAEPATARVAFTREDEAQTVRMIVHAPADAPAGAHTIKAIVSLESGRLAARFDGGYQVIEYPHIERRHLYLPAETVVRLLDVRMAPGVRVGYVMGVGDEVPQAIEQLGASVDLLGPEDLAWGDLSRFDVIVTGVRAYESREDLRAHNDRLLKYAANGGTVIVQYNKFEFNLAQYGPYPAKVASDRVTDERAPVTILSPTHPVFTSPNRIAPDAWEGWIQERGLYFLGERDARYADLVELADPFESNAGPKRGALVEARVGQGRWVYLGLGLWRQLPAGTPGAYQLLANLLSLGSRP